MLDDNDDLASQLSVMMCNK